MGSHTPHGRARDRRRVDAAGRACRGWLALALMILPPAAFADDFVYVVRPGDNPWNLTERYLLGIDYWPRIQQLNRITDAAHMRPGTVLRIPSTWLRLVATEVRVTAWNGEVAWSTADDVPMAPFVGAVLRTGSRLRTGPGASATLTFEDGSRVLVLSDSEVAITQAARFATGGPSVQLLLVRGNLENVVTPRKEEPGRFEIRTPAAVAAVRGTTFRVGATGEAARSEVLGGAVELGNPRGRQSLREGFGSLARAGHAPLPPVVLLPAPDLATAPALVERLPFEAPIRPLAGATGYRTQLAPDRAFASVFSNRLVDRPGIAIADVPDGDYVARVRAVDANGIEGHAADRPITIHARPEPPVLIDPPIDAQVAADRPTLRWTVADSARYRIQVSGDPAFVAPAADASDVEAASLQLPVELAPGPWFWRVATIAPVIGQGPFSDPQAFRRVLPGPGVEPADLDRDPLDLRWRSQGPGVGYRVQLARERVFEQPLVDTVVADPHYLLKKPASGDYYLRVASISPDGFTGPWGAVQVLAIADASGPPWPVLLLFLVPFLFL